MRILITGGAGFIGSHLCKALIKQSHFVICMDNLITGKTENVNGLLSNSNFDFVQHDVTRHIEVDGDVGYVLHFASPASPIDYLNYPIQTLKVGSLGTHNALGLAKAKGAKFLLASTSEIYGDPQVHPQPEGYWGHVNPIGPRGVYDEAKRFAEAITMAYHNVHKIDIKIARIFNTFGECMRRGDGRVVPNFISQALAGEDVTVYGDGSQTRSFCYIDDMVEGTIKLMNSHIHEPINLGNPQEISILDMAEKVIELIGSGCSVAFKPLPVDDPKVRRPDVTKAKELLGWSPRVSLEEGLKRTIEWFKRKN